MSHPLPQEQETISGNATGYTDLDFELPEDQAERENGIAAFSLEADRAGAVSENEIPAVYRSDAAIADGQVVSYLPSAFRDQNPMGSAGHFLRWQPVRLP